MGYKEEGGGNGAVARELKHRNDSLLVDAGWKRDENNGKVWISPGGTGYSRMAAVKKMKDKRRHAAKYLALKGSTRGKNV